MRIYKKSQDFSTSVSEASENVYIFVLVSIGVLIYIQYFFVVWACLKFWPMKNIFWKLLAHKSLITPCLQIYGE